jgi:hypothetical protein
MVTDRNLWRTRKVTAASDYKRVYHLVLSNSKWRDGKVGLHVSICWGYIMVDIYTPLASIRSHLCLLGDSSA